MSAAPTFSASEGKKRQRVVGGRRNCVQRPSSMTEPVLVVSPTAYRACSMSAWITLRIDLDQNSFAARILVRAGPEYTQVPDIKTSKWGS
jgi:hypothetical protein